jgi:hypothetical protein
MPANGNGRALALWLVWRVLRDLRQPSEEKQQERW